MNPSPLFLPREEHIRAASDTQLSSFESNLLATLLKEEDQYDYNQLLKKPLSNDIHRILHQLCSLLHLSFSAIWMATMLLKKLIIQGYSLDLLTIVSCVTLSSKYQDSSSQSIDYELIAECCDISNIQHIHDAELHLLDTFSYDVCITTPDHFFSYISNLNNNFKQIVEQTRSFLSISSLSHQTLELLHNYPCSIVTLSLMCIITSNTFIIQQIKSFLQYKKEPSHYLTELLNCIKQLGNVVSQE